MNEFKPLLIDGNFVELPTEIKTLNDIFKVKPSVTEDEFHGGTNYEWKICNGEIIISAISYDKGKIDLMEIMTTDSGNSSKFKGFPFNIAINETTIADCKAIFGGYPISEDSSGSPAYSTLNVNLKNYWMSLFFNDKNILTSIKMAKNQYDLK